VPCSSPPSPRSTCARPRAQPDLAASEALNNALKHADADSIEVDLRVEGDALAVGVRDDGRGFDPGQEHPGHLGLHTMRDRAAAVGGGLDVTSAPGKGTRVAVRVP
jgi:signal transduction histidine kinase